MKKIFLDCGAHNGCSTEKFFRLIDDADDYEIHCFEPSSRIDSFMVRSPSNVVIHKVAVTNYDGNITFYGDWTIVKGKKRREATAQVKCVNLSRWIKENICENDHIILKMDVEGAEYDIIKCMHKDGTLAYINEVWIEIHSYKYFFNVQDDKLLIDTIEQYGIPCYAWGAEDPIKFDRIPWDKEYMFKHYETWQHKKDRDFNIPNVKDIPW